MWYWSIRNSVQRFAYGAARVRNNRYQWNYFVQRLVKILEKSRSIVIEEKVADVAYIIDSTNDEITDQTQMNQNVVQFMWGSHSTGISTVKRADNGAKTSKKIIVEEGGALVFSQGPQGEVAVILWPFMSEVHQRGLPFAEYDLDVKIKYDVFPAVPFFANIKIVDKPYILYKIFKSPCHLTNFSIKKTVRFFFAYSAVTSLFGHPSRLEKIWVQFVEWRNRKNPLKKSNQWIKLMFDISKAIFSKWFASAVIGGA